MFIIRHRRQGHGFRTQHQQAGCGSHTQSFPHPLRSAHVKCRSILVEQRCCLLLLGMSGVTCDDFDQAVYDLAMDAVVSNATFSEADCATTASRRSARRVALGSLVAGLATGTGLVATALQARDARSAT